MKDYIVIATNYSSVWIEDIEFDKPDIVVGIIKAKDRENAIEIASNQYGISESILDAKQII